MQVKDNFTLFIFINDNILNVILQYAVIVYLFLSLWETGIPDLLGASILRNVDRTLKFHKRQIGLALIKLTNTDTSGFTGWL